MSAFHFRVLIINDQLSFVFDKDPAGVKSSAINET